MLNFVEKACSVTSFQVRIDGASCKKNERHVFEDNCFNNFRISDLIFFSATFAAYISLGMFFNLLIDNRDIVNTNACVSITCF